MQADSLRAAMVDELRVMDGIRTDRVASAFRSVPRHLFVPGESLASAYAANASVLSKRDEHGVMISTVSAAHIQAVMLDRQHLRQRLQRSGTATSPSPGPYGVSASTEEGALHLSLKS
jgi:protein-L-isoaspartate(D-aspartate) O-methyltransferase